MIIRLEDVMSDVVDAFKRQIDYSRSRALSGYPETKEIASEDFGIKPWKRCWLHKGWSIAQEFSRKLRYKLLVSII